MNVNVLLGDGEEVSFLSPSPGIIDCRGNSYSVLRFSAQSRQAR